MAQEQLGFRDGSCTAAVDLSTKQFYAVKITAANVVNLTTVAGEPCFGILQNTPTAGQPCDVQCGTGKTKAKAGAGVAAGARVMAGADGRIITAATTGSTCIGWAMEAALAANNLFTILFTPSGIV
jgi:hypothetical protein